MCLCVCVSGRATLLLPFTFSHLAPGALSGPIDSLLSTAVAPHYRAALNELPILECSVFMEAARRDCIFIYSLSGECVNKSYSCAAA